MKEKYLIELDVDSIPIVEQSLREFMGKVFQASKDSNCLGHGLEITKLDE